MSAINPPAGPWTVADLDALPDLGHRYEIHEGKLVMIPVAGRWHSRTMRLLTNVLEAAGMPAEMRVGVRKSDHSMRVADVAIFHTMPTELNRALWAPEELATVIEIVSEVSLDDDRFLKPRWYAMAGIPEFWRVEQGEHDEAVIYQYKLARTTDGVAAYVETGITTLEKLEASR